jgi:hypothetical protein
LVVIEIGPDLEIPLDPPQAESTLLRNCEDAYGFPPYAQLAPFLYSWNGEDLRITERDIISQALAGCPATLIRSQTRNWWERLPALMGGRASKRAAVSAPQAAVSAPQAAVEARGAHVTSVRPGSEVHVVARWETENLRESL